MKRWRVPIRRQQELVFIIEAETAEDAYDRALAGEGILEEDEHQEDTDVEVTGDIVEDEE